MNPDPNEKTAQSKSPRLLVSLSLSAALFLGLGAFHPIAGQASTRGGTAPASEFEVRARQFVSDYCVKCHGKRRPKAGVRLDTVLHDLTEDKTARRWSDILAQVLYLEMPPRKSRQQPTASRRAEFLQMVEAELTRHGKGYGLAQKMVLPQFGNLVDHQSLFDGSVTAMPYTPARLWRQRPAIYDGIWKNAYGRAPWYSVKIGGTGVHRLRRGPHKGKLLAHRYFSDAKYANPFFEFVHHASGFTDYASILADQSSLEALLVNAETMAEILTVGQKVRVVTQIKNKGSRTGNNEAMFVGGVTTSANEYRGRVPVIFRKIMNTAGAIDRQDFDAALDVAFSLFLRRRPRIEEYEHHWQKVFLKNAELGNTMALQSVLIFVTLSPEFVYRMELGLGTKDAHGRRFLSPHELVYAIHHAFHNSPAFGVADIESVDVYTKNSPPPIRKTMTTARPAWSARNSALAAAMLDGKLATRADVERIVRKTLDASQKNWLTNHNRTYLSSPNPRILQFFREFFGYYKAVEVFKDVNKFEQRDGFKQFVSGSAARFEYDTDSLIRHILSEDKHVLRELLTTNKVVVSYWDGRNPEDKVKRARGEAKYRETHHLQSYNLDPFDLAYDRQKSPDPAVRRNGKVFRAPKDQRCGILTQPSWLVAHSGNFDNDPVRRGKWIREKLLAGAVLDVPITVNAQIPDDEHQTLRERFRVVRAKECWRCHRAMNPLGMPFEAFNHVGRWRRLEKARPVDTSGKISHTGDATLHGDVADVRALMEKLAASDLVRQSFIRHVFRYWMGRNEMLSDSKTLIAMDRAYVTSDGSFKELLVSLLTSDSFLYRK